jgi:hypothetical protein
MDDLDDKALVILEAERARRLQAKIDAGEVVSVRTDVVVHRDEDVEEATARAIARHPIPDDHIRELFYIYIGVPRRPDYGNNEETSSPQAEISSEGTLSPPSSEPVRRVHLSPTEPAYIFTTTRQATDDGDLGAISEALWSVDEDGAVVVTTLDGKHITGRALLKNEDPLTVARALLRGREASTDFQAPIRYPKLGLA